MRKIYKQVTLLHLSIYIKEVIWIPKRLINEIEKVQLRLLKLENGIESDRRKHNKLVDEYGKRRFYNKLHVHGPGMSEIQSTHNILPIALISLIMLSGMLSLFYFGGGITGSTVLDGSVAQASQDNLLTSIMPFMASAKYLLSGAIFILILIAGILITISYNR